MIALATGESVPAALGLGVVFAAAATITGLLGAWVYRADRRNRRQP